MQNDSCCSNSGLGRWFCPSIVGVVAGAIMIAAGASKFVAGPDMLTGVGGMALGIFGISGHAQVAYYLGVIAAAIEVVGGISFATGCRKTSRWAAFFLSIVIGIALITKLQNLKPLEGGIVNKVAGFMSQIRLDLLLFAVFFQKGLKLIKSWCGMGCGSCCSTPAKK
ncbi:hypothetical protein KA057_02865 [Candidatus Gracilibacteria bacterium]|nr:hypothetical protein [Candidatus Gracilibacteria bacterium]